MLDLNWSLLWNIFNILVLFLLLKHFLFKPITKLMESRTAEIENNLKEAEEKKQAADELGARYEKRLEEAQAQAAEIVREARERGEKEYGGILDSAAQDARREAERARAQLELEREQMLRGARDSVAELALAAAAKVSEKELDQEADRRLVDAFLAETGERP